MLVYTLLLLLLLHFCTAADVVVQTQHGKLRGVRTDHSGAYVDTYKGIPYALPPTGYHRFSPPAPATSWSGTRDATHFRSTCPQWNSHNEDCLYLNIYSMKNKTHTTPPQPVMVFIHGGSSESGSGSSYDGTELSLFGVVVVTINYRLGALGFLSTEDAAAPGNYGMLDQVLALKWVRDNIAVFGGDPHHVTIFGESSGAASVSFLLLSPISKGLFHGAIMESGVSITEWSYRLSTDHPSPLQQAKFIGNRVGCSQTNTAQMVECLRKVSVTNIVSAQDKNTVAPGRIQWSPVIESCFLPEHPKTLIDKGMLMDVPTMRGVNREECTYFMTYIHGISHGMSMTTAKDRIHQFVTRRYSTNQQAMITAMEDVYLKDVNPSDHVAIRTRIIRFLTDIEYYIPALSESESQASKGGSPVYMYEFDHRSPKDHTPSWEGVPHGAELAYIFGKPLQGGAHWTEVDKTVSRRMMGYFSNFAKHGDPSYGGVTWDPFTVNKKSYLAIDSSSVVKTDARPAEEKLWLETLPKLANTRVDPIIG